MKQDKILILEDNDDDFETIERSFKKTNISNPMLRCVNGEDGLDLLYNRGAYTDKEKYQKPIIILLDLNMPRVDGKEVLALFYLSFPKGNSRKACGFSHRNNHLIKRESPEGTT